jgi:hypothetical protein
MVRGRVHLSAIPLFDRRRHHSSVPTKAVAAAARNGRPGRPKGRREAASPWTVASTVARSFCWDSRLWFCGGCLVCSFDGRVRRKGAEAHSVEVLRSFGGEWLGAG